MRARAVTLLLALVLLAGCGGEHDAAPRQALQAFFAYVVAEDVSGACATATPAAVAELARDFGGGDCAETLAAVARYVRTTPGQRAALARAHVLKQGDTPLSPAPTRAGATVTQFRVSLRDPVLRQTQKLDVTLRRRGGRWRVDAGVAALFTLLAPPV
jgi:hypothetical protein